MFPQRRECSAVRRFIGYDHKQQAGNERFGFFIPMHLAAGAWLIGDNRISKRADVFGKIQADKVGSSRLNAAEVSPVMAKGSRMCTGPNCCRAREVILAFSPLGSMQMIELSAVGRFGMMVPTPLPLRVGAMVNSCVGPS